MQRCRSPPAPCRGAENCAWVESPCLLCCASCPTSWPPLQSKDARFSQHPCVKGPPGIRFYAGGGPSCSDALRHCCKRLPLPPGQLPATSAGCCQAVLGNFSPPARSRRATSPANRTPPLLPHTGAPLIGSRRHRLGSLCVIDMRPRSISAGLLNTLTNFAELVVREIERDQVGAGAKSGAGKGTLDPHQLVELWWCGRS